MLESMRQLALDALWVELDSGQSPDPEAWYLEFREKALGKLFPKLVENVEQDGGNDTQRFYTLRADPNQANVAVLDVHELKPGDTAKLPFNQASGSQAAALGPLIKRTPRTRAKDPGPSVKIQQTTLKAFQGIANSNAPWGPYF